MSEASRAGAARAPGRTLHLHIGLPKTASTWLQSRVFPRLGHLRHVATPRSRLFDEPADRALERRLMACALRRPPRVWDALGDAILAEVLGARPDWLAENRDLLISDEAIGRAASRPDHLARHLDAIAHAAARWGMTRLHAVCLIRRQDHWLASHYAQMSDRNPRPSQRDFEAFLRRVADPEGARHGFGSLIDHAATREAILSSGAALTVLPYEAFRRAPAEALGTLLDRLRTPEAEARAVVRASVGTAENVRSGGGVWRLRPRSFALPGGRRATLPGWMRIARRRGIALTPELSALALDAYAQSNRALALAERIDLHALGYLRGGEP